MNKIRVALLAASPVYYRTPLYQRLASHPKIDFTAIFASNGGIRPVNLGHSVPVAWDVDLLGGYKATFLKRAATNPIGGDFFTFHDFDVVSQMIRGGFDVLWLWGYNLLTHQLAVVTQLALRRPIIFHEDQTRLDCRPMWKRAIKRATLPLIFGRGRALYVGKQNYQWFYHYGVRADRLYFAPHAVDNAGLQEKRQRLQPDKEKLRRDIGIACDSGPVILSVMRLIPKKQPDFLLGAFRRIRAKRKCTLLVVGSGVLERSLRAQVERDQIPDVIFAGFVKQSEIARVYAAADIFALVSKEQETWGLVVNEAMNFGLPVVVSDKVGCADDLVYHGDNGYVVSSTNSDSLVDSLVSLVDSAAKRAAFGRRSLEVVNKYNYEAAASGIINAIRDSVGPMRWAAAGEELMMIDNHEVSAR